LFLRIEKKVGVIGAGHMGAAIISGLLRSGTLAPSNLQACDTDKEVCARIARTYGISCYSNNRQLVDGSDIVIIVVKPKDVASVLREIKDVTTSSHLVISVAAGLRIGYIEKRLGSGVQVVRVMPNTPVVVGEGITCISAGSKVTEDNLKIASVIFNSFGKVAVVAEENLDAVTGLSGAGPAYIYIVIEALTDAGIAVGLPKDLALTLSAQTTFGAAKMVLESGQNPAELRQTVATPGGVTIEGIKALEQGGLRDVFKEAVSRATERSKELAKD
jgi:pyrroline-5-carboxylate reductase